MRLYTNFLKVCPNNYHYTQRNWKIFLIGQPSRRYACTYRKQNPSLFKKKSLWIRRLPCSASLTKFQKLSMTLIHSMYLSERTLVLAKYRKEIMWVFELSTISEDWSFTYLWRICTWRSRFIMVMSFHYFHDGIIDHLWYQKIS